MPDNDSEWVFYILMAENFAVQTLLITAAVLVPSMIADVVEDAEVKTGRRAEGLLFSADNLFRKLVSGVGVFVSGLVLTLSHFPERAERGAVAQEVLNNMALIYLPIYIVLFIAAMLAVSAFGINRQIHEDNVRVLDERRRAEAGDGG